MQTSMLNIFRAIQTPVPNFLIHRRQVYADSANNLQYEHFLEQLFFEDWVLFKYFFASGSNVY